MSRSDAPLQDPESYNESWESHHTHQNSTCRLPTGAPHPPSQRSCAPLQDTKSNRYLHESHHTRQKSTCHFPTGAATLS